MAEVTPNVHDPDIRAMVLRDHQPHELWNMGGGLIAVRCDTCGHDWPCTSIETARYVQENVYPLDNQ